MNDSDALSELNRLHSPVTLRAIKDHIDKYRPVYTSIINGIPSRQFTGGHENRHVNEFIRGLNNLKDRTVGEIANLTTFSNTPLSFTFLNIHYYIFAKFTQTRNGRQILDSDATKAHINAYIYQRHPAESSSAARRRAAVTRLPTTLIGPTDSEIRRRNQRTQERRSAHDAGLTEQSLTGIVSDDSSDDEAPAARQPVQRAPPAARQPARQPSRQQAQPAPDMCQTSLQVMTTRMVEYIRSYPDRVYVHNKSATDLVQPATDSTGQATNPVRQDQPENPRVCTKQTSSLEAFTISKRIELTPAHKQAISTVIANIDDDIDFEYFWDSENSVFSLSRLAHNISFDIPSPIEHVTFAELYKATEGNLPCTIKIENHKALFVTCHAMMHGLRHELQYIVNSSKPLVTQARSYLKWMDSFVHGNHALQDAQEQTNVKAFVRTLCENGPDSVFRVIRSERTLKRSEDPIVMNAGDTNYYTCEPYFTDPPQYMLYFPECGSFKTGIYTVEQLRTQLPIGPPRCLHRILHKNVLMDVYIFASSAKQVTASDKYRFMYTEDSSGRVHILLETMDGEPVRLEDFKTPVSYYPGVDYPDADAETEYSDDFEEEEAATGGASRSSKVVAIVGLLALTFVAGFLPRVRV